MADSPKTSAWAARWNRWVDNRSPRRRALQLTQRNVYILPVVGGWIYGLVVLVLLVAAINEQLNLAFALAFLLGGVGMSTMWLTHANLRGVELQLGATPPGHAGGTIWVEVHARVVEGRPTRHALRLGTDLVFDIEVGEVTRVPVPMAAARRGWVELPRWRIETVYPLGLFRAWAYWRAAPAVLVWPALETSPPPRPHGPGEGPQAGIVGRTSSADVPDGLREWRRGDALRDVAWRKSASRLATGQTPVTRERPRHTPPSQWLTWDSTEGLDSEARLSRLATWAVDAERQTLTDGPAYGLRLPGCEIEPGKGQVHLHRCLDALAGWGQSPPEAAP